MGRVGRKCLPAVPVLVGLVGPPADAPPAQADGARLGSGTAALTKQAAPEPGAADERGRSPGQEPLASVWYWCTQSSVWSYVAIGTCLMLSFFRSLTRGTLAAGPDVSCLTPLFTDAK